MIVDLIILWLMLVAGIAAVFLIAKMLMHISAWLCGIVWKKPGHD